MSRNPEDDDDHLYVFLLEHTCNCAKSACDMPGCVSVRHMLRHLTRCGDRFSCETCTRVMRLIKRHIQRCVDPCCCGVPGCYAAHTTFDNQAFRTYKRQWIAAHRRRQRRRRRRRPRRCTVSSDGTSTSGGFRCSHVAGRRRSDTRPCLLRGHAS